MKGLIRSLALVAVVLLVAACMSSGDVISGKPWKLAEIGGSAPVDPDGIIGVSFGADGRFQVNTGCRSGGGTFHADGNRIVLDSETLQPNSCDEAMAAQDVILLGAIEGRPRFEIDTGTGRLRLTGERGDVLLFDSP
jgi:heat shock protein HslJ